MKINTATGEPHLELRSQSVWGMIIFFSLWLGWKLTGYVILSPTWSLIGFWVSLCFFIMSYALKADMDRLRRKIDKEFEKSRGGRGR